MTYDVTDTYTGTKILSNARPAEVYQYFGKTYINLTRLIYSDTPYLKQYEIRVATYDKEDEGCTATLPKDLLSEWKKINRSFSKVEWVSKDDWAPDVKTLQIGD